VTCARAAAAIVLLAAVRALADGGDPVSFHGEVHLRATADAGVPSAAVRFDPALQAFAVGDYLQPQSPDRYGSALVGLALAGRHLDGDLRWVLAADTGELRSERGHQSSQVCWSRTTATGLAQPGSGDCSLYGTALRRRIFAVEDTRLAAAELTANGRTIADEASATWFVREAYVELRMGRAGFLAASAGRRRTTVGDGYIHDDYATGVELRADLGAIGPPFELSAALFQPTRDLPSTVEGISPMLVLRADWLPSLFERAGLFAAGLRERTGSLGNVFRDAITERLVVVADDPTRTEAERRSAQRWLSATVSAPFDSDATLGWLGTSGLLLPWRGGRLTWTAALLGGTLHQVDASGGADPLAVAKDVTLRGQLVSVHLDADVARRVTLGGWLLYLSGGELPRRTLDASGELPPATGTFRGFVAVSPYITETNIFFGGGLSDSFADREARVPGVNGRGVLAPGLSVRYAPAEPVDLRLRSAYLRADATGPFGGHTYGVETDLEATWEVRDWLRLGAEADVLVPGDFFPSRQPVTRMLLALDVQTP
jgi:hypothetical protein